ncbi:MAG: YybS family protein [Candidatus Hydrogenedentes bacterium]|nr:YybS family protein [Candidatus Hydrogenedentota bacterium]
MLFILGLFFMLVSAHPFAAMCFVILAAQHWLAEERPKAWSVAFLSGVVSAILTASLALGVFYVASASLGCLLGLLIQRGWSYRSRFAAIAGLASAGMAGSMAITWQASRHDMTIFMNARIAELEEQGEATEHWLEFFRWYDLNLAYFGIGSTIALVLLMTAYVLCVIDRRQRKASEKPQRRTTEFQRMRLPDWLVWVAIVVALLCFAEHRWPNEVLRIISWNAAIALASVYWLNGFSILLYALAVLKVTTLASVAIISGMFVFGLMQLLGLFGLFDTWYDFRIRFRRLAMLRRVTLRSDDRDV